MQNCKTVGCGEMTEDMLCEHHRMVAAHKRLKMKEGEGLAYKACAKWQRYKPIVEGRTPICYECKGNGEVVHYYPNENVKFNQRMILLCNACHSQYH